MWETERILMCWWEQVGSTGINQISTNFDKMWQLSAADVSVWDFKQDRCFADVFTHHFAYFHKCWIGGETFCKCLKLEIIHKYLIFSHNYLNYSTGNYLWEWTVKPTSCSTYLYSWIKIKHGPCGIKHNHKLMPILPRLVSNKQQAQTFSQHFSNVCCKPERDLLQRATSSCNLHFQHRNFKLANFTVAWDQLRRSQSSHRHKSKDSSTSAKGC